MHSTLEYTRELLALLEKLYSNYCIKLETWSLLKFPIIFNSPKSTNPSYFQNFETSRVIRCETLPPFVRSFRMPAQHFYFNLRSLHQICNFSDSFISRTSVSSVPTSASSTYSTSDIRYFPLESLLFGFSTTSTFDTRWILDLRILEKH